MSERLNPRWTGPGLIVGVDEAGRGPLAGPVVAAAVMLDAAKPLVAELKKEKEAVGIREQQLNDLALRLQNERTELNQITQKVFQMQREFDTNVVRVREEELPNLKRLVKVYSSSP